MPPADRPLEIPLRTWARTAGIGYLLIIVTGIFAEFVVRQSLIVTGDPGATVDHIVASSGLYRSSLVAEFVMLISDVLLAGALYVIFATVHRGLALTAAFFRLAHAAIVATNLLNVYIPLLLLSGGPAGSAFTADQVGALVMLFLEAQSYGYVVGLVFFGVHCLLMGYLVVRSGFVPRWIGWLLMLAAAGYVADGVARTLLAAYGDVASLFMGLVFVPAFIGELSFALWLLVRAGRVVSTATPTSSTP